MSDASNTPIEPKKPVTVAEFELALTLAQNWGGWSYEEADIICRALLTAYDGGLGLTRFADTLMLIQPSDQKVLDYSEVVL